MKNLILLLCLLPACVYAQGNGQWFVFDASNARAGNVTDMSHWLDKPAGKHGFLGFKGKDFTFEDGTPVKFWGVNICSDYPFVDHDEAAKWTRFIARHGINGVRFHKFTWDATDGITSTQLTPGKWANFDYFNNELRNAGIYYGWSHIYGHRVLPGDSARLLAYEEVRDTRFPWSHLNGTTSAIVNFADDLQVINIELTVNMLNHVNPHTGLRYAEDPALAFVELQNEDDIFWGAIEETLKQTPTYRALLCKKFSTWLKEKYGSQEALTRAWEGKGLDEGASIDAGNLYPHPSHSLFSNEYEEAVKENRAVPRYIADRAAFLFSEQEKFYTKFVEAIRATGYKGIIIGSCWQAGSGITHFYNLYSDYKVGPIDRHNYFGGGTGHRLTPGKFRNTAMISRPGSGLLSTGLQMVTDRPFQLSEWMSLIPTEWTAESAPLIAVYGMGLQGWDASYAFAMDFSHYSPTVQQGNGVYNVPTPTHLALYPALSAMVYRDDITEGDVIANRNVNIEDLEKGKLNFVERTAQEYDVKSFESGVPVEALAAGAVTVSFNQPGSDHYGNLDTYIDTTRKRVTSNTGELIWDYQEKGYCTVNTPGTKGVIGFAAGKELQLDNVTLQTSNEFAVVLVTSLEKDRSIADSKRILITTVARARNTGMEYSDDKTTLVNVGAAPIQLEPVEVNLTIRRKGNPKLYVLDHAGNRTGVTVPIRKGKALLDGGVYRAIYYEVEYPNQ